MKFITHEQYIKYLKNRDFIQLKEEGTEYKLQEKNYEEEKIKEIDKRHDKMFRNILSRKKEMAQFLNQFLVLSQKIKGEELIQCPTDFITKQYKNRYSDIVYRLKEKPVYFLVEHQSTIDQ